MRESMAGGMFLARNEHALRRWARRNCVQDVELPESYPVFAHEARYSDETTYAAYLYPEDLRRMLRKLERLEVEGGGRDPRHAV